MRTSVQNSLSKRVAAKFLFLKVMLERFSLTVFDALN